MRLRKKFAAAIAGLSLAFASPLAAKDNPAPAPVAETAKPETAAAALRAYVTDTRDTEYLCADGTASCWNAQDREAVAVWDLKNMLMLSALGCRLQAGFENLGDDYDKFYARNRALLAETYGRVAARFAGHFPPAEERTAKRAHDKLDTTTANMFSRAAAKAGFCETAGPLLRHLATDKDADARAVARQLTLPSLAEKPAKGPGA